MLPGKMLNNLKRQRGFTLLETLVALAVFALVLISLLSLFPFGINAALSAKQETLGVNLAQAKIEEIISQNYDEVSVGAAVEQDLSAIDPDFASYKRTTTVNYVDANLNVSQSNIGLKKIKIEVTWNDGLKQTPATATLTTLITPL